MEYVFKVTGYYVADIQDEDMSQEEVEDAAWKSIDEADFGCLQDIEWKFHRKGNS